jgi:Spy/CpxP family protein refolding chaperone
MIFRMRRILTTEQHVKLQKIFEEHEKDRRGKGHGQK